MAADGQNHIAEVLQTQQAEILEGWVAAQTAATRGRASRAEVENQARQFLSELAAAAARGDPEHTDGEAWQPVREMLADLSRERARLGHTPTETASFVFSLKEPLFAALQRAQAGDAEVLGQALWAATRLLDALGLYTTEIYQRSREDVIVRQQQELLELSTPVVQLWKNILALPLIGTLDSNRTQVVMESLLQRIVETGSAIAIIDITGVPTVDTLVAQHLLKTVAAARLMGADCIISGIRPQTAQTIVHLGVDLSAVITKANLADAFAVALGRLGLSIRRAAG
jgi:rsbT co-antagonist protein RsbR